jgi:hypothetical protein
MNSQLEIVNDNNEEKSSTTTVKMIYSQLRRIAVSKQHRIYIRESGVKEKTIINVCDLVHSPTLCVNIKLFFPFFPIHEEKLRERKIMGKFQFLSNSPPHTTPTVSVRIYT